MITRCPLCHNVNACIGPSGPQQKGGLLFVGEAPGVQENRKGQVFIGPTGEEVNRHYLPLAGLRRDQTCFANAISCLPPTASGKLDASKAKDLALLDSCASHFLYPLIEKMRPRVIIPMGSFACRAVCPDVDLDVQHGFPVETAWGIPAFPMDHPARGLHEPKRMLYLRTNWDRLRQYLKGTLKLPPDNYSNPDYQELTYVEEIEDLDPTQPLALDTESSREGPFCLTLTQHPGSGRLIQASRVDHLRELEARCRDWESDILFHNWLYDWPIVEAMGLHLPTRRVVDTMARAYHLGNLPQGLKALAYRELGMTMQDFTDLVGPYSTQEVLRYYRLAYAEDWTKPEMQTVRDKEGKWKLYKPQSMKTKFKRFFTDYQKSPDTKSVFDMWTENWEEDQGAIEEKMGPWPGMDIRHVPFEKILYYACRDVDALIRIWPLLKHMSTQVRRTSQERWRERAT